MSTVASELLSPPLLESYNVASSARAIPEVNCSSPPTGEPVHASSESHESGVAAHAAMPAIGSPPRIDKVFVLSVAAAANQGGEKTVREHHRNMYDQARGSERGVLTAMQQGLMGRVDALAARVKQLRSDLANCRRFWDDPSKEGRTPWTVMARAGMSVLVLTSLALLFTDAHACATTLQESGIAIYVVSPWRAWVASSAPFILSFVAKVLLSLIEGNRARNNVTLLLSCVSISAALLWAYLFSTSFPGLAQPAAEILGDPFHSTATSEAPNHLANLLVLIQIIAGGFGSAVMFQLAHRIFETHSTGRRFETLEYSALRRALDLIDPQRQFETEQLGRIDGRLKEIDAEGKAFCDRAAVLYLALAKEI